jgi:hypothetical protein
MDIVIIFLFYGSILFCLTASTIKIVGFVTTPLHLKWEYYNGSSVYESMEWWTRPNTGLIVKDVNFSCKFFM